MSNLERADLLIKLYLKTVENNITLSDNYGRQAARELLGILSDGDAEIRQRLRYLSRITGGLGSIFDAQNAMIYRTHLETIVRSVAGALTELTSTNALRSAELSVVRIENTIRGLDRLFLGVDQPVQVRESMMMYLRPSLLRRHVNSFERYGSRMISTIEQELARGMLEGISQGQMVDRLMDAGKESSKNILMQPGLSIQGPKTRGILFKNRAQAWRIVRTEVAEAQNAAAFEGMRDLSGNIPDMKKKILAVLDLRTAPDSIAVHGQVRPIDGMFIDGAGREYLRPPSRPNDRETIIPWRSYWPETKTSRPLSQSQISTMSRRNEAWQNERRTKRRKAS